MGPCLSSVLASARILVVDDHEDTIDLYSMVFSGLGAEVRAMRSASAGLRMAKTWSPTVLVTELELPFVSGFDLAVQLRAQWPQTRLVATSSNARDREREKALMAGFHAFLVKPVDLDDLCRAVGGPDWRGRQVSGQHLG